MGGIPRNAVYIDTARLIGRCKSEFYRHQPENHRKTSIDPFEQGRSYYDELSYRCRNNAAFFAPRGSPADKV